jgi:hypothetical protein
MSGVSSGVSLAPSYFNPGASFLAGVSSGVSWRVRKPTHPDVHSSHSSLLVMVCRLQYNRQAKLASESRSQIRRLDGMGAKRIQRTELFCIDTRALTQSASSRPGEALPQRGVDFAVEVGGFEDFAGL